MKRCLTIAHEFFLKPAFKPHFLLQSSVPSETLDAFFADRGKFFLGFSKLTKKREFKEHGVKVQSTVGQANLLTSEVGSSFMKTTFRECPLVWDTGALFGLTLFRGDFIDYVECQIPVKDIVCTNMVVGMGTTLHKFQVDGEPIWLPCLSCHLLPTEIHLFSPQTYHMLYGGRSVVQGGRVEMFVGEHRISISIDQEGGNEPTIFNTTVSWKEISKIGPCVCSALPCAEQRTDFLGGWSADIFSTWKVKTVCNEFDHYAGFLWAVCCIAGQCELDCCPEGVAALALEIWDLDETDTGPHETAAV